MLVAEKDILQTVIVEDPKSYTDSLGKISF